MDATMGRDNCDMLRNLGLQSQIGGLVSLTVEDDERVLSIDDWQDV